MGRGHARCSQSRLNSAAVRRIAFLACMILAPAASAQAQTTTGAPGAPNATTTIDGRYAAAAAAEVRRRDRAQRGAVEALLADARRAAQGRAEHPADHDRRRRLRRALDLRRRHPDAGARPHRRRWPALHQFPLDVALLADPRRADHRPQPSFGRLRRRLRGSRPASPATTASSARTRRPSAASCWRTATAPRGSARTTTRRPIRRARPARSTSGRPAWASNISTASSAATRASGSRTSSATRRRSIPMSASREMEPDDGDGRRRHPLAEPAQRHRPRCRSSSTTCRAAPMRRITDAGMDREDQRHASLRQGLERRCATRSSPTRRSSA